MTDTIKILAQAVPTANSLTDIYTAPSAVAISSIMICNQSAVSSTIFRISLAIGGAADDPKQYIYYDVPLLNSDTFIVTAGITLATGDIVRVRADLNSVSFSLFGAEVI